jgi:polysaccharide export outer membrane protein
MALTRTFFLWQAIVAVPLIPLGIAGVSSAAEVEKVPPKVLTQYIRQAKDQGATEERIRQQAIILGWPAAMVDEAIAFEKGGNVPQPETPAPLTAEAAASVPKPDRAATAEETPLSQPMFDDYQIGSGDTLQISVWKELDVSVPSVVVRPDGRITVPLIKEVEVGGLTPRQAEKVITEKLSKFITDPNVTVVVAAINSKKVYVIGGARKEGPLPYTYGMTVMQALSEAGGLTDYAKRKKIYILRTENGREYRLDFNYDDVVKGQRMDQNILLLAGDTVVIPR